MINAGQAGGTAGDRRPRSVDLHVGMRLRLRRTIAGMSQVRLAEVLGISFQQIQKYEQATSRISASRLHDLSKALDVPVDFFFDGIDYGSLSPLDRSGASQSIPLAGSIGLPPNDVLFQRETMELTRAYRRVPDPVVRKRLLDLIRSLQPGRAEAAMIPQA